jgi:bifunctional lysine-specific demethylase and histidyl-hydroxylase NO66
MFDLNWLLAPFDKNSFFNDVWQKKPQVLASGRDGYFETLFGSVNMERALEFSQPRPPSIRLSSSGSNEKAQVPFCPNGRLDMDKLRKLYLQGQTVILNLVEDFDPAVAQLARSIETEMGARVQVNAYLTPPSAQGFHAHYDTHDVLVAQIQGNKLWKVYGRDSVCPLNEMTDGDPKLRESAVRPDDIQLSPGDLLYIPRGWIHEAKTAETASLHLTLGIHAPLAKDLLSSALDVLVRHHPEFREALPIGPLGAAAHQSALADRFAALVKLFSEKASLAEATNAIDDNLLRRGRSGGDGHLFRDVNSLRDISNKTVLERRTDVVCRTILSENGAALQFLNGLITGPAHFEPAMRFVERQTKPFAVADLPGLETDHQLALGTSLVTDGLCSMRDSHW